jgi:hypothetical protein
MLLGPVVALQLIVAREKDVMVAWARRDRARPWLVGEAAALEGLLPAATAWCWWLLDPTQRRGEEKGEIMAVA